MMLLLLIIIVRKNTQPTVVTSRSSIVFQFSFIFLLLHENTHWDCLYVLVVVRWSDRDLSVVPHCVFPSKLSVSDVTFSFVQCWIIVCPTPTDDVCDVTGLLSTTPQPIVTTSVCLRWWVRGRAPTSWTTEAAALYTTLPLPTPTGSTSVRLSPSTPVNRIRWEQPDPDGGFCVIGVWSTC